MIIYNANHCLYYCNFTFLCKIV